MPRGLVLAFDAPGARDASTAGGKGARLSELAAHGFPVPPGFVVAADAYRAFADRLGVRDETGGLAGASDDDLRRRCADLRQRLVGAAMAADLSAAIVDAYRRLSGGSDDVRCAVRSSATAEDQAGASFAGQHGTYYYVGREHLLPMIRRCWASLWTPEAVRYRSTHGIANDAIAMAVVVQEMIPADVSGVTFTANPVTGDRGEVIIESSWGMGAALVDGRVTPDRYVVTRGAFSVRDRRIADKRCMVPPHLEAGSDGRLIDVPADLRRRETLSPEQVECVARWAVKCEEHYGAPQDVEWAMAGGRFHLLQSRPITTLGTGRPADDLPGQYVLFKPIAENFTEPATPLTIDLLMATTEPFMRVIDGRPYCDLDWWRPLVPVELSDEDLAELLYSMFAIAPRHVQVTLRRLVTATAIGAIGWLVAGVTLMRTRSLPDDCMESFRALCREVDADPRVSPADAIRRLGFSPRLLEPIGRMPVLVNVTCLRFAAWLALLRLMLRRWAKDVPASTAAVLCAGAEGMRSADMGRAIEALADEARQTPVVASLLVEIPADRALARLRDEPAARPFLQQLDRFLAEHGHRAVREFEIRAPRWAENPAPVLGMIRNCLVAGMETSGHADTAMRARDEAERAVDLAVARRPLERAFGLRRRLVRHAARRTRYFLKLRENSRFYHIMSIGVTRRKVLRIEAELLRDGTLKCADDIFFLRWREIAALRTGRLGWLDVEERIRARRMEHVRLTKITPRKTIGIALAPREAPDPPIGQFEGLSASPGSYEGVARVILDPTIDAALDPGEVLVAPYTDPAWTPLFLTAGAAVVEVGSYLSHAGTVAREYGMPCVVDVADCTRRIRSGQRVHVDGTRGVVCVIAERGAA